MLSDMRGEIEEMLQKMQAAVRAATRPVRR
jgi:hypothetical protein